MKRLKVLVPAFVSFITLGGMAFAAPAEFVARATSVPELKAVFGQVESRTILPARARIGGTIREIAVTEGSEVREGEVIGRVVDDKLALQLDSANAKIKELRSQLENAQTEFDRTQQLFSRGVSSQSQIDQARNKLNVAVNQVAAAEADMAVVGQRTREGDILAPTTGRVLTVPFRVGSVILAGEEIARIASGQYYLRLSLPERHAIEIKEGGSVLIGRRGLSPSETGGMATARQGRIVKVYPEIMAGRVTADVDVAGLGDYFVNERTLVWMPVGKRAAILVPPAAVATRHGVDYVRLATPDGPLDVAVILGEIFPDDGEPRVEILTGLREGDRVLLPESAR
ncbi:MAG: efflux RND transporter periplasmic adaptor subunit [Beijerinckiaceae bacterium]